MAILGNNGVSVSVSGSNDDWERASRNTRHAEWRQTICDGLTWEANCLQVCNFTTIEERLNKRPPRYAV